MPDETETEAETDTETDSETDSETEAETDFDSRSTGPFALAQRVLLPLGALLVLGGLGLGAYRIAALHAHEVEVYSAPALLAPTDGEPHRELVRAALAVGSDVLFEVCTERVLDEDWVDGLSFYVFHPEDDGIVIEAPLDAELLARARHASFGTCMTLGRGQAIPVGGEYSIEAVWLGGALPDGAGDTEFVGRIAGNPPLGGDDPWAVLFVLAGALALVLGLSRPAPPPPATESASPLPALLAVMGLLVVMFALAFVPLVGSLAALGRGLIIAAAEIGLALALVPAVAAYSRTQRLGLLPPRRIYMLAIAPAVGLVLFFVGRILANTVPATGEASIAALVSFSSGALTLALISVVVPVAEELFFRGLVFGSLERRLGGLGAFGVTVLLFALAHLPQVWGDWGSLIAILFTGAGLTALRWWSGSTTICIIAHLAHNAIIVFASL